MDRRLTAWYEPRRAAYPWRRRPTPYRVLVSEMMLQQTQAARVVPAFRRFVRRFPSLGALAAASRAEVIRTWAGLGYNRRAVALSESAREIARDHGGRLPRDPEVLRRLPGVGPYTASAVAAIAFGAPLAAIDTNVRRVVSRSALGVEPDEVPAAELSEAADAALDRSDPATWNQAVMDLGREVCRPAPRCDVCPLAARCRFRASGRRPEARPRRDARFAGSSRQVRGRIVEALRRSDRMTLAYLASFTGVEVERAAVAVRGLHREGLVTAGPAALAGRPLGRVSLVHESPAISPSGRAWAKMGTG